VETGSRIVQRGFLPGSRVPVVGALIVGKWLDARYGTKPMMLLILAGLGFLISIIGIVRVVTRYTAKIKKEVEKQRK